MRRLAVFALRAQFTASHGRRLLRILLNGATALSLALCVATAVLWVRGHYVEDSIAWRRNDAWRVFRSSPGHFIIDVNVSNWSGGPTGWQYAREAPNPHALSDAEVSGYVLNVSPGDSWTMWVRGGFAWWRWKGRGGNSIAMLAIPAWSIVTANLLLPLGWGLVRLHRSRMRHRSRRVGQCSACGYDLRATPARCPECGVVPRTVGLEVPKDVVKSGSGTD